MIHFPDLKTIEAWLPQLDRAKIPLLLQYCEILFSQAMPAGFIGDCDPLTLLQRHLLDSLLPLTSPVNDLFSEGAYFCDLGSGAGLPGIPLAICRPAVQFTAIEASARRAAFLKETAARLGLNNFVVFDKEIELFKPRRLADGVIYRAFRKPLASLELALYALRPQGSALYFRAKPLDFNQPQAARRLQELGYQIAAFHTFATPAELGSRGIYHFVRSGKAASGYPRPWRKIARDELCEQFA